MGSFLHHQRQNVNCPPPKSTPNLSTVTGTPIYTRTHVPAPEVCRFSPGDDVEITRGKLKGKCGTVLSVYSEEDRTFGASQKKQMWALDRWTYWAIEVSITEERTVKVFRQGSLIPFTPVTPEIVEAAKRDLLQDLKDLVS